MRRLAHLYCLLSGFAFAAACGGAAQTSGGDGDGDGDNANGAGGTEGDGDGSGGTLGDGDLSGDGDTDQMVCQPGAVALCDVQADPVCTAIRLCDSTGTAWGACLCADDDRGDGGVGGAGGAGGAGSVDEPTCSEATACGGDVRGNWEVSSSCLHVKGALNILSIGLGCSSAPISGSLEVRGQLGFLADGRFVDGTTTWGDFALSLPQSCLDVSGTVVSCEDIGRPLRSLGFSSVGCVDSPTGGCVCGAQVNQVGSLGQITSEALMTGEYTAIDETLTLTGPLAISYSYCAVGEDLVLTPTDPTAVFRARGAVELESVPFDVR